MENERYLKEAIRQYSINEHTAKLIRHNENITYEIIDSKTDEKYVLRIHRPAEGYSLQLFGGKNHTEDYLKSELYLVSYMGSMFESKMQTPVKNSKGELVSKLSDGTCATMLTWAEGNILSEIKMTSNILYDIGKMTAKMHEHIRKIPINTEISRLHYDKDLLANAKLYINNAYTQNYIKEDHMQAIMKAIEEIRERMRKLDTCSDSFGMVHADLSSSNLIYYNGSIIPIDFCLSGYGYYYQDLGGLIAEFTKQQDRQQIIAGYESICGKNIETYYIEPFMALAVIMYIACQYEKASKDELFGAALDKWCLTVFTPLYEKKSYVFI